MSPLCITWPLELGTGLFFGPAGLYKMLVPTRLRQTLPAWDAYWPAHLKVFNTGLIRSLHALHLCALINKFNYDHLERILSQPPSGAAKNYTGRSRSQGVLFMWQWGQYNEIHVKNSKGFKICERLSGTTPAALTILMQPAAAHSSAVTHRRILQRNWDWNCLARHLLSELRQRHGCNEAIVQKSSWFRKWNPRWTIRRGSKSVSVSVVPPPAAVTLLMQPAAAKIVMQCKMGPSQQ